VTEAPRPPRIPFLRLMGLTLVTAALAFAVQALLSATDAPAAEAINLAVVPIAAGIVLCVGLRPYPALGRARLALMVAAALFLAGLALA
jgi:hypothetical protein